MSDTPPSLPWVVRFKPHQKHARWRIAGVVATHREAVNLIGCEPNADWWLSDRPEHQPSPPATQPPCDEPA